MFESASYITLFSLEGNIVKQNAALSVLKILEQSEKCYFSDFKSC